MMHSNPKRKAILFFFLTTLVFSTHSISQENISNFVAKAKKQAISELADPDSAKFRNLEVKEYTNKEDKRRLILCGEINAKNRFGGYAGFRPFSADEDMSIIINDQFGHVMIEVWKIQCGPTVKLVKILK